MALPNLLAALRDPPQPLRVLAGVPGLHVVGGWLRLAWQGKASTDLDLVCEGPVDEFAALIAELTGAEPFTVNERFATRRFVLDGWTLDLSQMAQGGIEADIARRDYTVNTLMVELGRLGPGGTAVPAVGVAGGTPALPIAAHPQALADLQSHTLRIVSAQNLADDPLRILRGYRLCATEGFAPEPQTRAAWRELAPRVLDSAPERIHDELLRWFGVGVAPARPANTSEEGRACATPTFHDTLSWAVSDGVMPAIFPPLTAMAGCIQSEGIDVLNHTLGCLAQFDGLRGELPPELEPWRGQLAVEWERPVSAQASAGALTRIAMLLHDCAKPQTRAEDSDGKLSFHGHPDLGAELAAPLLERLRFSAAERDYVLLLIREHLRLGYYSDYEVVPPRLVYRYIRKLGPATPLMLLHGIADCMATRGSWTARALEEHVRAAAQILGHYYAADSVAAPPVLLDGEAIMALLGIRPGKLVGELKEALLEATAAGEVANLAQAEQFVRHKAAELNL